MIFTGNLFSFNIDVSLISDFAPNIYLPSVPIDIDTSLGLCSFSWELTAALIIFYLVVVSALYLYDSYYSDDNRYVCPVCNTDPCLCPKVCPECNQYPCACSPRGK